MLNGQKRWITNGGVASFYTVFARAEGTQRHKGITCFVVDRDTPGVSVGKKENKMGQRASNTTDVIFEDVKLGKKNVVGAGGRGLQGRDEDLRPLAPVDRRRRRRHDPARARRERASTRSSARRSACPIAQHQAVQFMLAEMAIAYEATRLLCHKAAWGIDKGKLDSIVSSYAKAYGADAAMRVADRRRADLRRLRLHQGLPRSRS